MNKHLNKEQITELIDIFTPALIYVNVEERYNKTPFSYINDLLKKMKLNKMENKNEFIALHTACVLNEKILSTLLKIEDYNFKDLDNKKLMKFITEQQDNGFNFVPVLENILHETSARTNTKKIAQFSLKALISITDKYPELKAPVHIYYIDVNLSRYNHFSSTNSLSKELTKKSSYLTKYSDFPDAQKKLSEITTLNKYKSVDFLDYLEALKIKNLKNLKIREKKYLNDSFSKDFFSMEFNLKYKPMSDNFETNQKFHDFFCLKIIQFLNEKYNSNNHMEISIGNISLLNTQFIFNTENAEDILKIKPIIKSLSKDASRVYDVYLNSLNYIEFSENSEKTFNYHYLNQNLENKNFSTRVKI